jgi:hypothetical protein
VPASEIHVPNAVIDQPTQGPVARAAMRGEASERIVAEAGLADPRRSRVSGEGCTRGDLGRVTVGRATCIDAPVAIPDDPGGSMDWRPRCGAARAFFVIETSIVA